MKKSLLIAGVLVVLLLGVIIISSDNKVSGILVTMYKSPTCGCCVGHASELGRSDFNVNIIPDGNLESLKESYNIPREVWSCHTSLIGDYFVEGHMPIEAINKLLEEQPDIDGIAFPGMPSGAPGMPGYKNEEWIIYSVKDGKVSEFMRI